MNKFLKYFLPLIFLAYGMRASSQIIEEDTTTNKPFFAAKKFNSKCYVELQGAATQILNTQAGMTTGISLNWIINHRFVISAQYYALSSPLNIQTIVSPDFAGKNIYLHKQFAGLGFSYIFFNNKLFSLQPQISGGWGNTNYKDSTSHRKNYSEIIPAVYGIYNATKYFRLGLGLNYRATIGSALNGLKDQQVSGLSGIIFIRVGTF